VTARSVANPLRFVRAIEMSEPLRAFPGFVPGGDGVLLEVQQHAICDGDLAGVVDREAPCHDLDAVAADSGPQPLLFRARSAMARLMLSALQLW